MNNKYIKFSFFLFLAILINPIFTTKVVSIHFIVHSSVYQLFTGLISFLLLCFCISILVSKEKQFLSIVIKKLNDYEKYIVTHYINTKLNTNILAGYRIVFSLISIILIYNYFTFFDVIWFHIEHEENILLLKITLWAWLVISFLLLVGVGGRYVGVIQLILSVFIMRNTYTFGIFELTHLCNSWAFVLLRTDSRFSLNNYFYRQKNALRFLSIIPQHTPVILLYLIGIYFGFIFLSAGIDKLLDPLWIEGNGFYAFCVMPWTLPDYLKFIQESRIITYIGNYSGLFIEITFLPFFILRKTRVFSVITATMLFIGLIYPFNIFFIGFYAVLFGILLMSTFPYFTYHEDTKIEYKFNTKIKNRILIACTFISIYFISSNYMKILLGQSLNNIYNMKLQNVDTSSEEKVVSYNLKNKPLSSSSSEEKLEDLHFNELYSLSSILKTWFVRIIPVGLFSSKQLIGQYAYRVIITKKDGTKVEPIKYFMEDKSRGELDRRYFMLNIFQGALYAHGDMATCLYSEINLNPNYPILYRFIHYSIQQSNLSTKEIAYVSTFVAPMDVPIEYKGNYKQNKTEWKEMIRFTENEGYRIIENPVVQPYQARNAFLSNYLPRILYKSWQLK